MEKLRFMADGEVAADPDERFISDEELQKAKATERLPVAQPRTWRRAIKDAEGVFGLEPDDEEWRRCSV
jgi:hypothetical protein